MKPKSNSGPGRANALSDLIAEDLIAASGAELDAILHEWGLDPKKAAESVDAAFRAAQKKCAAVRLEEAKRARDREIQKLSGERSELPADRDQLLAAVRARLATIDPSHMTILHRDFTEYTESALRSMLTQLNALDRGKRSGTGDA